MNNAGVRIKDYLGDFVANHVDLSEGRVALKVTSREVEILGEALVKEVIGWAVEFQSAPMPVYGDYDADFLAGLGMQQHGANEDDVVVRFTSGDVLTLGQFFVLGMLKWVQSILKQTGILDKQRAESWQAVWAPQDISVDGADPYTVRIIGKQEITKLIAGAPQPETHQLSLTLKLVANPQKHSDRNLRSGFLVASFDYRELPTSASSEVAASR